MSNERERESERERERETGRQTDIDKDIRIHTSKERERERERERARARERERGTERRTEGVDRFYATPAEPHTKPNTLLQILVYLAPENEEPLDAIWRHHLERPNERSSPGTER